MSFLEANNKTEAALVAKGYETRYAYGLDTCHCQQDYIAEDFPNTLVWAWAKWKKKTDANTPSQAGYSSLTNTVSFSPSVDYNDATTALAYDKGYGRFLGIYSTDKVYVTGTSVTGYQSSRRSAQSITFVSQVNCDSFSVAYNAATAGGNSAALQAAIQAVINAEYPVVGTASSPSLSGVTSDSSQCAVHSDDGLSGATIAGVVVGSVVGALLLGGLIWYGTVSSKAAPTPGISSTSNALKVTASGFSGTSGSVHVGDRSCC